MSSRLPREYSYREFSDYARRFNQEDLLTAVAQRAASLPDDAHELPYRATPPWALAGLVKASICEGNAYRSTRVRPKDILTGCHMYNNLVTHELHQPGLNSGFNILARIAHEQFPYQESIFEEMARPELFFCDYSGRKQLEVISEEPDGASWRPGTHGRCRRAHPVHQRQEKRWVLRPGLARPAKLL